MVTNDDDIIITLFVVVVVNGVLKLGRVCGSEITHTDPCTLHTHTHTYVHTLL